ncbi:FecCD family ABC transporter permease [Alicyclobacillus kakegawensis]|uniref:FecCD family ABC transporter permease n=1 Tax=Alicyclobacillus kakegawensis TaxID=392012 RepID=UPI000834756C|nr:iron ABC transporter permease [Alicyclobacillus kakegawensis]
MTIRSLWSGSSQSRTRRTRTVMIALMLLLVAALLVSLDTGYIRMSPVEVVRTFAGAGSTEDELALYSFRLPRLLIAVLLGVGLAVSGCVLQGVSRNALADPGILGINAGAGLVVMLFTFLYPTNDAVPTWLLPCLAFVGGGFAGWLTYALSYRHGGVSPVRLVLSGVAVAAGIDAAMIVLTVRLSPDRYQFVSEWLAGSILGSSWAFVLALLPWLLVLLPFVYSQAAVLNVLNLGEEMAAGLGIRVERARIRLLAGAVGLAASAVAVGGAISFVGLIAPHLARRLVGSNHQSLLPASALVGGLLVLVADTIGRTVLQPSEIPTGIVVAVVGAPYFLYLLARSET